MATSTSTAVDTGTTTPETRPLLWARLGSLLSIFPLGIWTVAHLWNNLAAFEGAQAWQRSVTEYANPFSMSVSLVVVLLPLILHAVWGVQRLGSSRPNVVHYGYYGNLKYTLQRVAGVGVLLFLGAHIWLAFLHPRLVEGHAETFGDISQQMHYHLPTLLVYIFGTLGVCYHLANGIQGFAWTWGLAAGRKAVARLDWVAVLVFIVLTAMSWTIIYQLYQYGGTLPAPANVLTLR